MGHVVVVAQMGGGSLSRTVTGVTGKMKGRCQIGRTFRDRTARTWSHWLLERQEARPG